VGGRNSFRFAQSADKISEIFLGTVRQLMVLCATMNWYFAPRLGGMRHMESGTMRHDY
jgi:hypothetical protein